MWNNGGRDVKLDQAEVMDMGPLSGDSRFNMEVCTVTKWFQKFI